MLIVSNGTPLPNTAAGANPATYGFTNSNKFQTTVNAPGSLRLDGAECIVRASGNISAGVSSTAQFMLYANYPTLPNGALQYPVANITNAVGNTTGGANVALYNAANNFVIGQYVTVAGTANALNGVVGPLLVANSTAFAGLVNTANVGNVAAANYTGTATLLPQPLYQGVASPALNVSGIAPFMAEVRIVGDQQSGILVAYGTDQVVNYNAVSGGVGAAQVNLIQAVTSTGQCFPVPGVNFKNEPPFSLSAGFIWGSSNAANTATLKAFYIES